MVEGQRADKLTLLKFNFMKAQMDLKELLNKGVLETELDLARALQLDKSLRLLIKEQPLLAEDRKRLRTLIKSYEAKHWTNSDNISEEQVKESDAAEFLAYQEKQFLLKRKEVIKEYLIKLQLTQQDLGVILGHSKTYISELMNGIIPFSQKDLIIIHRLFHIPLDILIPTTISQKDRDKLRISLSKLNKPKLKLKKELLEFA